MGFLDRLRASENNSIVDWKLLTKLDQISVINSTSIHKPAIIFKHSTSCGISAGAKYRLEVDWAELVMDLDFYFLDLISHRSVSNEIAIHYGIRHQSPQIIVVKNGKAIYDTSHHRISISDLNRFLGQH